MAFWSMMVFLGVLTVGFAYEWDEVRRAVLPRVDPVHHI